MAYNNRKNVTISTGNYITFDGVDLNYGNAFDIQNGLFIAPYNGTYAFSLTTHSQGWHSNNKNGNLQIERNGVDHLTILFKNQVYENIAFSWMMNLNLGDTMKIKVTKNEIFADRHANTLLSGRIQESCDVIFSSYWNSETHVSSGSLKYDSFLVNYGNAFDGNVFKAPFDGVYEFNFLVNSDSGEGQIDVLKNNVASLSFSNSDVQYESLSATWLFQLKTNDEIKLNVARGTIYSNTNATRFFNGKLIEYQSTLDHAVIFCAYANPYVEVSEFYNTIF